MATPTLNYMPSSAGTPTRGSGLYIPDPLRRLTGPRPSPQPTAPQPAPQPSGSTSYPGTPQSYNNNPGGQDPTGTKYDVDPAGRMTPWTPYSSGPGQTSWRPGETEDLFELNMKRMFEVMGKIGGPGGEGASSPREGFTPVGRETPTTMADRTAAESAAFGRSKDRIGKISQQALSALKDQFSATGMSGSGVEADQLRELTQGAAGELGDVVRDQTLDRMRRTDEVDDRNMNFNLTQRGQDISQNAQDYTGRISQRGQDLAAQQAERQAQLSWLPQMLRSMNFGLWA